MENVRTSLNEPVPWENKLVSTSHWATPGCPKATSNPVQRGASLTCKTKRFLSDLWKLNDRVRMTLGLRQNVCPTTEKQSTYSTHSALVTNHRLACICQCVTMKSHRTQQHHPSPLLWTTLNTAKTNLEAQTPQTLLGNTHHNSPQIETQWYWTKRKNMYHHWCLYASGPQCHQAGDSKSRHRHSSRRQTTFSIAFV